MPYVNDSITGGIIPDASEVAEEKKSLSLKFVENKVVIPEGSEYVSGFRGGLRSDITIIEIPSSVKRIKADAFRECKGLKEVHISDISEWCNIEFENEFSTPFWSGAKLYLGDKLVETLEIPRGVSEIKDYAFAYCSNINEVIVPDTVEKIGLCSFAWCNKIETITVDGSEEKAKEFFSGLIENTQKVFVVHSGGTFVIESKLKEPYVKNGTLIIPEGITEIKAHAFEERMDFSKVIIPDSVTSIGEYAFSYCIELTSVTIGSGVTSIGHKVFYHCTRLTSITIPDGVTSIGPCAFLDCSSLKSITIPDGVTSIGPYAFLDCSSLKSITIPNSITNIGDSAFCHCTGLTSITIPDSVASIGDSAFYDCTGLTSVTIGSGVSSIGYEVFYGCWRLECIKYRGTKKQWREIEKDKDWKSKHFLKIECTDGVVRKW